MDFPSLPRLLEDTARRNASKAIFQFKRDGTWHDVTWGEALALVDRLALALIAAGVKPGDRVGILSRTRLEWAVSDFGIVSAGGVTVGLYQSGTASDCAYILEHAEVGVLIVEDPAQLEKVLSVRDRTPGLHTLVLLDGDPAGETGVVRWDEFLERGDPGLLEELERRKAALGPEDMASLVYTSGTTGVPKGVILTHGNLVFISWCAGRMLHIEGHYRTLLFLPLAHVFARLIMHCCMRVSCTIAFAEDILKVADNLQEVRPHFIASVPRIYEKVQDRVLMAVATASPLRRRLFEWSLGVGRQVSAYRQRREPVPWFLALRYRIAERLVLHKVQGAFGGQLVYAVSGGAPLNPAIAEWFHACGVLILEGIGMTENTSFSNVNLMTHYKFGTVGPAGPKVEMRVAEDGEVLYRGPNVMRGYYKDPEATAQAIDAEGWLHTGDIGEIDADGFLKITDRKKDLIITSGGKNIAPQRVERTLRTTPYVSQVMVFGDRKNYLTALVTLDLPNVRAWAEKQGITDASAEALSANPRVRELVEREIDERNRELAPFETVKRFHILPADFTIEAGELTPTLKLRRRVIYQKYRNEIDALYAR